MMTSPPKLIRPVLPILIFCLSFILISTVQAADSFELGNQAYMHNNFSQAIKYYQQTAAQRGFSSALLYNMGNSYAQLGRAGQAILAYEQALRLDHGDPDIRTNLASIRKKSGIYQQDQSWWRRTADFLGTDQWLLLATISFFSFCSCFLLIVLLQKPSITTRLLKVVSISALVIAVLSLPPALYGYLHWHDAVVLTRTRLKISPFAESATTGILAEGRIVHPLKNYRNFILVRDTTGRKGWLAAGELGFIDRLEPKVGSMPATQ